MRIALVERSSGRRSRHNARPTSRIAVLGVASSLLLSVAVANSGLASAATIDVGKDSWSTGDHSGWSNAELGGSYTLTGQLDSFRTSGGHGLVAGLQPGRSAGAYLPVNTRDVSVQDVVNVSVANAINSHHAVEARRQADGTSYRGRIKLTADGQVGASLSRNNGKTETGLASVKLPLTVRPGQDVVLQLAATGTDAVQLSFRAWIAGTSVPSWQIVATDTSDARITGAGDAGVWDYVSSSGSVTSVAHDDLKVTATVADPASTSTPSTTTTATTTTVQTYRSANFDSWPSGTVVPSNFVSALGNTNTNSGAYDDMTVVADSRGSGKVLRTTLKAGTIHSKPGGDNGNNLFVQLPTVVDSACISYDIKFDSNFDWSLGGKLPGLEGVAPGVAPSVPTGGGETQLGWSGRAMWLGPKAYSWAGPTNQGVTYMYHTGQSSYYGDNVRWNKPFVAGRWHNVKQCYTMNTVGSANGKLAVWMDGTQVINDNAFTYRSRSDVRISHMIFSIFRGGGTLDWAGSRDGYVDIDNLKITSA